VWHSEKQDEDASSSIAIVAIVIDPLSEILNLQKEPKPGKCLFFNRNLAAICESIF
jgi:hypothetical protein